jgi:tetratricopeptide (TPR) repeat protein
MTRKKVFSIPALLRPALSCVAAAALCGCSRVPPQEAVAISEAAVQAKDWESAEPALRSVVRAFPSSWEALYNLGSARLAAGRASEAISPLSKAVKLVAGTSETRPLEALAAAQRLSGDPDSAYFTLKAVEEKVYRKPWLLASLAAVEMDRGNPGSAKAYLADALEIDETEPVALFNRAVLMSRPGIDYDHPAAARDFAAFIFSPRSGQFPEMRAEAVRRIAALNASRPDSLTEKLDMLLLAAHDTRLALGERLVKAAAAVKADWSNPAALAWYISLLRQQGDNRLADLNTGRGRILFPDDPRFAEGVAEVK